MQPADSKTKTRRRTLFRLSLSREGLFVFIIPDMDIVKVTAARRMNAGTKKRFCGKNFKREISKVLTVDAICIRPLQNPREKLL